MITQERKEETMDKATFVKTLKEIRAQWEALLAQVDKEWMLEPGAAEKWSVKDIIAHIAWSEQELVPVMQTHVLAGSELWNLSLDERNEVVYQQNQNRPLHEIMMEEQEAYAHFLQAVQELSEEDLNEPHRFNNMPEVWVPWQILAGSSFKHYQDHMPSVREWLMRREQKM
jgi:uncharacterized damage-inducible protein DinB